jgi:hypothetical protein
MVSKVTRYAFCRHILSKLDLILCNKGDSNRYIWLKKYIKNMVFYAIFLAGR